MVVVLSTNMKSTKKLNRPLTGQFTKSPSILRLGQQLSSRLVNPPVVEASRHYMFTSNEEKWVGDSPHINESLTGVR